MPQERRTGIWRTVLLCIAIGCFVLAAPCVFFGVLGLLGIVADAGVAENRRFGWQFLRMAWIPAVIGLVALLVALRLRHSKHE